MSLDPLHPCAASDLRGIPTTDGPDVELQADLVAAPQGPGVRTVRVRAIATADSDGRNSALDTHPESANDRCKFKYKIERSDIVALVNGANQIFAHLNLVFDPNTDFEFQRNTLLNRDSLTPPETVSDTQHVFYRDTQGRIQALSAGKAWTAENVTGAASAPAAASQPAIYATGASVVLHVIYRSGDGAIHELYSNAGRWVHNPISARANARGASLDPFGYASFDPATGEVTNQHVVYRGDDGHIHQLYTTRGWNHRVLTTLVQAPKAGGSPIGYTTFDDSGRMVVQHVVYRGTDNALYELYTVGDQWRVTRLNEVTGAPVPVGDPVAYTTDYGDVQHIVYRGSDRHVHELFARTEWRHNDLTARTGSPNTHSDPVAFVSNDTDTGVVDRQHVLFADPNGRIRELYTDGGWTARDVTAKTGVSFPQGWTAYTNREKTVCHVICRTSSDRLTELFFDAIRSTWHVADLTASAAAPLASESPFGYFRTSDRLCNDTRNRVARSHRGSIVVFFRYGGGGWSSAIDDFVVMPNLWNPRDLTFLAHELGHYFHLPHSMWQGSREDRRALSEQAKAAIKTYVEDLAKNASGGKLPETIPNDLIERGLEAIDADRPYVTDTPAQLALARRGACDSQDHPATISVTFDTKQQKTYEFEIDTPNVMNYAPKQGQPARFSPGQTLRMRIALELRNRKPLIT